MTEDGTEDDTEDEYGFYDRMATADGGCFEEYHPTAEQIADGERLMRKLFPNTKFTTDPAKVFIRKR